MSTSVYTNPDLWQHEAPPLLPHHRHHLEVESGIASDIIAARGYYSTNDPAHLIGLGFAEYQCRREMGPFLVIPEWTTGGIQRGYKLKADRPRTDRKTGKTIKYESPAGSRLQIDCPPDVRHLLRDPSVPLYITEGSKKADAAASRGLCCISISGVYGFMRGRMVLDDLDDIALDGRDVRPAFDSDVTTKPEVADARRRLAGAVDRRGAKVSFVTFTDRADGSKAGFDDYFVDGGTVDGIDALTHRWTSEAPFERIEPTSDLEVEVIHLRRQNRALMRIIKNPEAKDTRKMVWTNMLTLAASKRSRGEVEPDGRVLLEPRHIANDHRPAPKKGESKAERNPFDDTKPLTSRDKVESIVTEAAEAEIIAGFEVRKVPKQNDDGTWSKYPEILIDPPQLTEALERVAAYVPKDRKPREKYTWQQPCQSCGEVHSRTRRTYCDECGAEYEPAKHLPVPALRIVDESYVEDESASAERHEDVPETSFTKNVKPSNGDTAPLSVPISLEFTKNVKPPSPPPGISREDILNDYWEGA